MIIFIGIALFHNNHLPGRDERSANIESLIKTETDAHLTLYVNKHLVWYY